MAFYCLKPRIWPGRKPPAPLPPDMYSPESPGFTERNRKHVTELPGGLIRLDIGEPCQ